MGHEGSHSLAAEAYCLEEASAVLEFQIGHEPQRCPAVRGYTNAYSASIRTGRGLVHDSPEYRNLILGARLRERVEYHGDVLRWLELLIEARENWSFMRFCEPDVAGTSFIGQRAEHVLPVFKPSQRRREEAGERHERVLRRDKVQQRPQIVS
jgi:hypothetical protein